LVVFRSNIHLYREGHTVTKRPRESGNGSSSNGSLFNGSSSSSTSSPSKRRKLDQEDVKIDIKQEENEIRQIISLYNKKKKASPNNDGYKDLMDKLNTFDNYPGLVTFGGRKVDYKSRMIFYAISVLINHHGDSISSTNKASLILIALLKKYGKVVRNQNGAFGFQKFINFALSYAVRCKKTNLVVSMLTADFFRAIRLISFSNKTFLNRSKGYALNCAIRFDNLEMWGTILKKIAPNHIRPSLREKLIVHAVASAAFYSNAKMLRDLLTGDTYAAPSELDMLIRIESALKAAAKIAQISVLKLLLHTYGEHQCSGNKDTSWTLFHFCVENIPASTDDNRNEKIKVLLHWIKDRWISQLKTALSDEAIDKVKKKITHFLGIKLLQKNYPNIHRDFYNAYYNPDNNAKRANAQVTPIQLYCFITQLTTLFCLEEERVNELRFIRNHGSMIFLWNYGPLMTEINAKISQYDSFKDNIEFNVAYEDIGEYVKKAYNHVITLKAEQAKSWRNQEAQNSSINTSVGLNGSQ
jgi:hypothetical protein